MRGMAFVAAVTAIGVAGCEARQTPAEGDANAAAPATAATGPAAPGTSDKPLAIAAAATDLEWGPCPAGMPQGCEIAVLHGDPAKPNADIFLKVPAGAAIAPHWHSSAERMMLAAGSLAVKYQGSAEAVLEPGTYAYGPARLPHRAECRSAEPCVLFIAFEGPVDRHAFEGEV
jgi:uncharacterized RmlC-like cupin family protein